mgnify:CR=1 FL=1
MVAYNANTPSICLNIKLIKPVAAGIRIPPSPPGPKNPAATPVIPAMVEIAAEGIPTLSIGPRNGESSPVFGVNSPGKRFPLHTLKGTVPFP